MRSKISLAVILVSALATSLAAGVARADDDDPAKGNFTLEQLSTTTTCISGS